MQYSKFIKPKEIEVGDHTFTISRIPSTEAQPIYNEVAKSVSENGIVGVTMLPIQTIKAIMQYVAVQEDGDWVELENDVRINRTFVDNRDFQAVTIAMVKENFNFLITGDLLDLLVDEKEATGSAS